MLECGINLHIRHLLNYYKSTNFIGQQKNVENLSINRSMF